MRALRWNWTYPMNHAVYKIENGVFVQYTDSHIDYEINARRTLVIGVLSKNIHWVNFPIYIQAMNNFRKLQSVLSSNQYNLLLDRLKSDCDNLRSALRGDWIEYELGICQIGDKFILSTPSIIDITEIKTLIPRINPESILTVLRSSDTDHIGIPVYASKH